MTSNEDTKSQRRFLLLNLIRISGAIMLVVGLAVIANGVFALPVEAGYALFIVGLANFMLVPLLLARRWKSPPSA